MTNATPTVFALETDSAWVVILAVSAVTLVGTFAARSLLRRPAGLASGLLLVMPLVLPLVAAAAYAKAALPEIAVLRPMSPALLHEKRGLLHLLFLHDRQHDVVTPYALIGGAGRWIVIVGVVVSGFMLIRRFVGRVILHRVFRRCRPPASDLEEQAEVMVIRLAARAGMTMVPRLLILPDGVAGAFAVAGRRPSVLVSRDLLSVLEPDELEAVLAHEVAHIDARDVQVLAAAGLLRDVVAWNPLAHVALRRLARDRELEADRRAVALTGRPLDLAAGLIKVCDVLKGRRSMLHRATVAAAGTGPAVATRVRGLLALADSGNVVSSGGRLPYLLAACAVALSGLYAGARVAAPDRAAFALVWGWPGPVTDGELWRPARRQQSVEQGKAAAAARPLKKKKKAALARPRPDMYADFPSNVSLRSKNLSDWITWMSERVRRGRGALWEARTDWQMIPLIEDPIAAGVRVFTLSDRR